MSQSCAMAASRLCPTCGETNSGKARFCQSCGAALAAVPSETMSRRTVTVLFVDIVDSTGLSEQLDAETLRLIMSRYFEEMSAVITAHGGTIEKFIGDAICAIFGVPRLHEDDPSRAVHAALAMKDTLSHLNDELRRRWGVELRTRTGIHTGEAVTGSGGDGGHFIVSGETANVAMRVQQLAPSDHILVTQSAADQVKRSVELAPSASQRLKGVSASVSTYEVVRLKAHSVASTAFAGREDELQTLERAYEQVVGSPSAAAVTVVGQPGIGKSRLVEEFIKRLPGIPLVAWSRCPPFGRSSALQPIAEIVFQALDIRSSDAPDEAIRTIDGVLRAHENEIASVDASSRAPADAVAELLGLTALKGPIHENLWTARVLFDAISARRPLVAVLDDLQWADELLTELVANLLKFCSGPLLMICISRPEFLEQNPDWGASETGSIIALKGLSRSASETLLEGRISSHLVSERVLELAHGNPLFLVEMSAIAHSSNGDEGIRVPKTLHALLAARLDQLETLERNVLEGAAVIGEVFLREELSGILDKQFTANLPSLLDALLSKEFLRFDETRSLSTLRFAHILIRDVTYEHMTKRSRADLHERFADWLESVENDRVVAVDGLIGHHYEQAYLYRKELGEIDETANRVRQRAADRLGRAGEKAFWRVESPAVIDLLSRSTALMDDDTRRLELLEMVTEEVLNVGDLETGRKLLHDLQKSAKSLGDERAYGNALMNEVLYRIRTDPTFGPRELETEAETFIEIFTRLNHDANLATALALKAESRVMDNRYEEALGLMRQALKHVLRSKDAREISNIKWQKAWIEIFGPSPVSDCEASCLDLVREAVSDGRKIDEADGLSLLGCTWGMAARFGEARQAMADAGTIFQEVDLPETGWRHHLFWSGLIEMMAGDYSSAVKYLEQAISLNERMGQPARCAEIAPFLAECLLEIGERARTKEILGSVEDKGRVDARNRAHLVATQAKVLAVEDADEGIHRWEQAIAQMGDAVFVKTLVLIDGADILTMGDQPEKVPEVLARARDLIVKKGHIAFERRIEKLAASL